MKRIITSHSRPLHRALCTVLIGIAALWALPSNARAAAIDYTLTDVTANLIEYATQPPESDTLTGVFTFDPVTTDLLSANITVTGSTPYTGVYDVPSSATADSITVLGPTTVIGPYTLSIGFVGPLMSTSDPVSAVNLSLFEFSWGSVSVTGSAIPVPVPEPSPWSMVGVGGVALLGIMHRKKHRLLSGPAIPGGGRFRGHRRLRLMLGLR